MNTKYKELHKNCVDLTNQIFGEWKVLGYKGNSYWECECSCGNIKDVAAKMLKNRSSRSCGHITKTAQDITGKVFGEWKVLKHSFYKNKRHYWKCRCSCGVEKDLDTFSLTSGHSMSCGHSKLIDMVGERFGSLIVESYAGNKMWNCICDCGEHVIKLGKALRSGAIKSCGKPIHHVRNITGTVIGDLTVLKYIGNGAWECRCNCGNVVKIQSKYLNDGSRTNCGCKNKNKIQDLTGNEYGRLTALEYIGDRKWMCKCSCGKIVNVNTQCLTRGMTKSCGCLRLDIGNTLFNRYGERSTSKLKDPRAEWQIECSIDSNKLADNINKLTVELGRKPTSIEVGRLIGVNYTAALLYIHKFSLEELVDIRPYFSKGETEVYDFITSFIDKDKVKRNDRSTLGTEMDIYIPSIKVAIEFNGNYWHCTREKDRNYHRDKTVLAAKNGIRLIHIFEYEWNNKQELIKKYLLNVISNGHTIDISDTVAETITGNEASKFLSENHLDGDEDATINIALKHQNEVVAVMLFRPPKFDPLYQYELTRMCFKSGLSIDGGIEKLFQYFINHYNPINIICYTDISKFTGNSYTRLGFTCTKDDLTNPDYIWVAPHSKEVVTRYQIQQKEILNKRFGNDKKNAEEIMDSLGYMQVYDCGKLRLVWNKRVG